MSQTNCLRSGCKDVFHSYMVKNAFFEGELEIPFISPETVLPEKMIAFSKAVSGTKYEAWVHFYEDDVAFERLWNKPHKYLQILRKYKGVIAPDFSLYRDMPLVMQHWNIYRSHAVAVWLQNNGITVIPNVRWGDERTYDVCCSGVPKNAVIAVGSHGCIKISREREYFRKGLNYIVQKLNPQAIVVYGAAPDSLFSKYKETGIYIRQFDSEYKTAHRKVVNA